MSDDYDYVIVGAGSAGCVLANRLSADPQVSVALLEAGGRDRKLEIRIPAAFPKLFHSAYDWNLFTAKQEETAPTARSGSRSSARRTRYAPPSSQRAPKPGWRGCRS